MKRKKDLYKNLLKMENILKAYNEVCSHTKNKRKVRNYKENKCIYISRIYNILKNKEYVVGKYNVFTIYEPKKRVIVSQNLQDKVINHLISRQILYPALIPCLINENVASIENKGTRYGLELAQKFHTICKMKYKEYSKFPGVKKDLALIVEDKIPSQEIAMAIKKAAGNLLKEVEIFDVYTGKGIEKGKKSLAYSLTFEAQERTLTDDEINPVIEKINL